MRPPPVELDEVDRRLCELLAADPRPTNRALAGRLGITDETVAARLRRLRRDHVVATTVAVDWRAAGYEAGAFARIKVVGGDRPDFSALDGLGASIAFAALTVGCCDVVLGVLGVDLHDVRRTIIEARRALGPVSSVVVDTVTDSRLFGGHALSLPLRSWTSAELPNPQPPLDDLDRALVDELITNGHDANRKLARRLRVSDGTVRARIARLEDAGLLRIVTGVDPVATGQIVRTALAFITCHPPADDIVDRLRQHPLVLGAHRCVGRADLALQVGAGSDDELAAFLSRDLRTQPGVGEIEVATIANVVDRRSHLVRFADIA